MRSSVLILLGATAVAVVGLGFGAARAAGSGLILDGDFEAAQNSGALRIDNKGQDWYESRKDGKEGRKLLFLSKKEVGGNKTKKAMIKAHPDLNTYLSQSFSEAQTGDFAIQYDILVREILGDDNRSAFFMVGAVRDKKGGPNSTGIERFVFLGFENAKEKGKVNLFARERDTKWEDRKLIAQGLDLEKWYTIEVVVYPKAETYEVTVKGVVGPVEVAAFGQKKKAPKKLTHISFASWNDGAGTFFVDNVSARKE